MAKLMQDISDSREDIKMKAEEKVENGGFSEYGSLHIDEGTKMESTDKRCGCIPRWYFSELWEVFDIAWSMTLVALFFMVMAPLSMIFAGKMGTKYLDGVGLATTILNIFGIMIGQGMSTACDTLFSQAYGGQNKKKVGLYLQRALFILWLVVLPSWALLLNTENILILLGQEPEIASISGRYTLVFLPAIPAQYSYAVLSKYLRNQNIVRPIMFIGFTGLGMNALFQYILVDQLNMGVEGAALSQVIGFYTLAGSTATYIIVSKTYKVTWDGLTWTLFQEWGSFFKLAIAGLLMVSLQFWAFEAGTLLAGTLGQSQLAAQSIMFQIESITYMFPIGIAVGCNIRIGHLLGANNPKQASRAVFAGYTLAWGVAIFMVILLLTLRAYIPRIFSQDSAVVDLTSSLLPILALYYICDCTAGVSTGVLRGCGRQITAATIVFAGMYLVGLPAGVSMMLLTELKSAGFWWGMTIAMVCEGIAYLVSVYRTDWDKQAHMAQIRAGMFEKKKEKDSGISKDSVDDDENDLEISSDEKHPILSNGHLPNATSEKKRYCGEFQSSQPNLTSLEEPVMLTPHQLLFRRTLFILCFLGILGIGVFVRLKFSFPREMARLCLPYVPNGTVVVNGTIIDGNYSIPLCNSTLS